jgi:hypothetical protein
MYYRAYEKEWLNTHGQVITLAWIQDPTHVHVVLPHSILTRIHERDTDIPVPLTTITIKRLSITFTRDPTNNNRG